MATAETALTRSEILFRVLLALGFAGCLLWKIFWKS